jgi:site-specific DNA-methyltransferase (adenine-specific)
MKERYCMSDLRWWIEHGDAAEALKILPDGSVDALVTDPPAGIGFMGKEWDDFRRARNPADAGRDSVHGRFSRSGPEYGRRDRQHFIAWLADILTECRRAMKPGAYGWVWAIPRTAHWTATACEDAGFAVRDVMTHVFGTGFPKSRSLLKPAAEMWVLIKAPGELRELRIEENRIGGQGLHSVTQGKGSHGSDGWGMDQSKYEVKHSRESKDEAWLWVKPGGRWPANFALSHDDACTLSGTRKVKTGVAVMVNRDGGIHNQVYGDFKRLPSADVTYGDADGNEVVETWQCVEGCPVKVLDEQSGVSKSTGGRIGKKDQSSVATVPHGAYTAGDPGFGDSGTASRFFYVAKPSTRERSAGMAAGTKNTHVTVKSISLMRHLVSLVAAPGATILDPFAGSGSTGIAALAEDCRFIGIEKETEYVEIARQRIAAEAAKTS